MDAITFQQPGLQTAYGAPAANAEKPRRYEPPVREVASATLAGGQTSADLSARDYGALRARQDDLNALALTIRAGGAEPEVRKLYPPYPPEQEARMAYLDKLSGIRQQIERLIPAAQANLEAASSAEVEKIALRLSRQGAQLLSGDRAGLPLSTNRSLLETVAQTDTVQ